MFDLVFRAASVVREGRVDVLDVAVHRGRIERVEPRVGAAGGVEVDATGLVLMPGAIDLHVHLRDPGLTHKEDLATGTGFPNVFFLTYHLYRQYFPLMAMAVAGR